MQYTQQETEKFIFERNAKRSQEREAKRLRPQMVHLAKHAMGTILKFGLSKKGTTFIGSIRTKFTGPKRNNFGQVFSRN